MFVAQNANMLIASVAYYSLLITATWSFLAHIGSHHHSGDSSDLDRTESIFTTSFTILPIKVSAYFFILT